MVRGPSVAIVIPNWNGVRYLPDCLNSLEALDYPRDLLEVIVVDNGSTDASAEFAEGLALPVPLNVIRNEDNRSYSEANGQGVGAGRAAHDAGRKGVEKDDLGHLFAGRGEPKLN